MKSAEFWDKRSKQYDDAISRHDFPFDRTIERTKELLSRSDVLLDYGCGSGEFCLELAACVRRVYGIDTSTGMIDLAKGKVHERQIDNAIFDQTDLFGRNLDRQSFSSALAFSIFHLVDDVSTVLARLNDLLEPGGLLISETPCLGEKNWLFRSLISLAHKPGLLPKIRSLSRDELESAVTGNGFEIIESEIWDSKHASLWIVARNVSGRQTVSTVPRESM